MRADLRACRAGGGADLDGPLLRADRAPALPARTRAGYRDYGEEAATCLLFVHRARTIGLSCDQIADLLPIWGGADCSAAQQRVGQLIDEKQAEIAERISELQVRASAARGADHTRGLAVARGVPPDLSCCVPSGEIHLVPLDPRDASANQPRH